MTDAESEARAHAGTEPLKLRRLWLGSLLGALVAVLAVALTALLVGLFARLVLMAIFGPEGDVLSGGTDIRTGFLAGMTGAIFAALFNWYFFFITIPVTTLVLRFSLGRFPRRKIVRPEPYFRWGAIWGAILVSLPGMLGGFVFGGAMRTDTAAAGLRYVEIVSGALLASGLIGAISGLAVAGIFLLVVRPARQVRLFDPLSVF